MMQAPLFPHLPDPITPEPDDDPVPVVHIPVRCFKCNADVAAGEPHTPDCWWSPQRLPDRLRDAGDIYAWLRRLLYEAASEIERLRGTP